MLQSATKGSAASCEWNAKQFPSQGWAWVYPPEEESLVGRPSVILGWKLCKGSWSGLV